MSNDVKVNFKVIDQVTSEVKKINNSLNGFTDNITKSLKNFRGVASVTAVGVGAFYGLARAIDTCVKAAKEDELAQNRLNAALGYTSISLNLQTKALSDQHKMTQGEIVNIQQITARYFKNAEAIEKLTPAIINMSAVTGESTDKIAEQLASAIKTGKGLKQYGINLKDTATEQERIFKLTSEVNKIFGAQAEVTENLKGPMHEINTQIQELQGNIGSLLLVAKDIPFVSDAMTLVIDTLKGWNDIAFKKQQEELQKEIKKSSDAIISHRRDLDNLQETLKRFQGDEKIAIQIGTTFKLLNKAEVEKQIEETQKLLGIESNKYSGKKGLTNNGELSEDALKAQKKIEEDINKFKINAISDRLDKEKAQTIAHFKELTELATEQGLSTKTIEETLASELKRIEEEKTKFIEEQNQKQLEEAKKTSEERVRLITDEINKEKEYKNIIEDLYLTKTQLEDKAKKKEISDKYNKGIDAAYSSGKTFLGNILQNTRDQRLSDVDSARKEKSKYIVNVDENKYEQELNKFNESYGTNTDTVKSRFEQERIAAQEHFNEMINLYGTTSEKQKQIELQRTNALKLIDNEEKKVRKQNASDFLKNQLGTLQMLTEGNKKFSAINKTIAIASVTYDTVIAAMAAYKSAVKLGGVLGIVAGVAAAALVTANGLMQVSKIVNTKAYASGIRNTRDEFAQVHKDEIIHLPRGSEVINKRESVELIKEQQLVVNMFFEDRTSETYKIMQKDIKSGKIDQLVREITKRQQKVTY